MAKNSDIGLLLVRCGRTSWDEAGRFQGAADLPMCDSGRAALLAALEAVDPGDFEPGVILSAGDEASRDTAAVVGGVLGGKAKPAAGLSGMDFGLWQGLLDTELLDRYPTAYERWRRDPASVNPPEGETFLDFEVRVLTAVQKAVERAGSKDVVMVLRPMVFGLVRSWVMGAPTSRLWDLLEDGPQIEHHRVPRGLFRSILDSMKARA